MEEFDYIDFFDTIDDGLFTDDFGTDNDISFDMLCSGSVGDREDSVISEDDTTSGSTTESIEPVHKLSGLDKSEKQKKFKHFPPVSTNKYLAAFRKPCTNKVVWSLKNSTKGKTYRGYIERQLRIARQLCKQVIKLFNHHEADAFCEFVTHNCTEDVVFREKVPGVHPITGVVESDVEVTGITAFQAFVHSFFSGVPDSALIVEKIEVLNEGKLVSMRTVTVGTAVKSVDYPESSGSNELSPSFQPVDTKNVGSYALPGYLTFTLDKHNKLKRIDLINDPL